MERGATPSSGNCCGHPMIQMSKTFHCANLGCKNTFIRKTNGKYCLNCSKRVWAQKHPDRVNAATRKSDSKLKTEVLTYYGKGGKLSCCWRKCNIVDIDCLTIDHIKNDGQKHRKYGRRLTGRTLYRFLRMQGYPEGFQTLCANHQIKKEILRRGRLWK